jgi:hypothetical protein
MKEIMKGDREREMKKLGIIPKISQPYKPVNRAREAEESTFDDFI